MFLPDILLPFSPHQENTMETRILSHSYRNLKFRENIQCFVTLVQTAYPPFLHIRNITRSQ